MNTETKKVMGIVMYIFLGMAMGVFFGGMVMDVRDFSQIERAIETNHAQYNSKTGYVEYLTPDVEYILTNK